MVYSFPLSVKHSLNKAYLLIKPKSAAIKAFKSNLIYLLCQINDKESEENLFLYLQDILENTYFAPNYHEPENSSPVCYANAPDLREGFSDSFIPNLKTLSEFDSEFSTGTFPLNHFSVNSYLREALHAIKFSVRQILTAKQANPLAANTMLEKQIDELVYQLYELTPEEIAIVKRG